MPSFRDLTGQRFGCLVALRRDGTDPTKKTKWLCQCDCGNQSSHTMTNLVHGVAKSCGHLKNTGHRLIDLTGQRFGKLVAVSRNADNTWNCLCDCGGASIVASVHLRRSHTRSCGCLGRTSLPAHAANDRRLRAQSSRTWARNVKQQAEFRCEMCGSTNNLHAHHIAPWATFLEGRLWDDNGVCLCSLCHKRLHSRSASTGEHETAVFADMMSSSTRWEVFKQCIDINVGLDRT